MVAYNFKAQFAPLVESGQKCQTIRALGKRRTPMPGEKLQLYIGMRTKSCRKLLEVSCVAVQPVRIDDGAVYVAGERLPYIDALKLAKDDGFESLDAFLVFFRKTHGSSFEGVLIKWNAEKLSLNFEG